MTTINLYNSTDVYNNNMHGNYGSELKANYYALYLCIMKNYSSSKSLSLMGLMKK